MKSKISILTFLTCAALISSCNKVNPSESSSNELSSSNSSESEELSSSILSSESSLSSSEISSSSENDEFDLITIAEAIEIAKASGSTVSAQKYYVKGIIEAVSNPTYGEMTIKDDTGSLYVYGVYDKDEKTRYDALEDKPVRGDEVILYGALKTYNDKPEMDRGYLQKFTHNNPIGDVDLTKYIEKNVAEAREAAVDEQLKVSGVVGAITYADGMKPNGFYLIDSTSSIYVYDPQVAMQVSVGNKITLAALKTYYVLASEQSNATKFGYQGCCQLQKSILLENDKKVNDIDLSWTKETTIKSIMDTPVSENITTNIYKVNALVKRVIGTGFTNYYFNDIDGKTGSYTYTSNSGKDFSYLDEFDGKICSVYLSPINCKSTSSGCIYRFFPISVKDENYKFDESKACKFAIDYYGTEQFLKSYTSDPELKMIKEVKSDLLNLDTITLNYTSSDANVIYFENKGNDLIMHTKNSGKAIINITANYKSYSETTTYEIEVKEPISYDTISVLEAINSNVGDEVTVKGIVTSSLINQDGFYISDDQGFLAVRVKDSSVLATLSIGDEVIVKGTRYQAKKDETQTNIGHACINQAELLDNLYGKHEYSMSLFETKTMSELFALKDTAMDQDYTTTPYKTRGKITKVAAQFYTNYYIENPENPEEKFQFYAANGGQYAMLDPYVNQVIDVEIAMCNWNSKKYYTFCLIAIETEDGKIMNTGKLKK